MKLNSSVTYLFIIWLFSILFICYLGFSSLPHSGKFNNNFWQSFANWDGGHYLGIAKFGYSQKFQYAFFPLYPLAIRLLGQITQNYLLAAILISSGATFLGLNILYKLVSLDFDKKIAEKTIIIFLIFPTSFFLFTVYSEGLFFFLAVLTFYLMRQKKLFWAVVAGALASVTRPIGLAVVAGLFIDVITREGLNRKNWYILFTPAGFIIYSIFLYKQVGDPFYFITAEYHWQRILSIPGMSFWETLQNISKGGFSNLNFNVFLNLIFSVLGVGAVIRSFRFLLPSYAAYSLIAVAVPLFTTTLSSMPRFLLIVFPIFILAALIKNRYLYLFFQIISIMLLAVFAVLFITGYWVA